MLGSQILRTSFDSTEIINEPLEAKVEILGEEQRHKRV
jgi:hypothetical protein